MVQAECPSCYFEFSPEEEVMVGEVITCPDCGVDLEVMKVNGDKLEVQVAEVGAEDWGE
jgi:alpha-aminoadipate/glutamate carrier protein LysW